MFSWFERRIDPFPESAPEAPPKNLLAFCWHYAKGSRRALFGLSILSAIVAVLEVSLVSYLGQLVDWFATRDPQTFIQEEKNSLIWMGAVVLVFLPLAIMLHSLINHQTVMANFPMRIRWQAHRYLLGQSLAFFHEEYAGRIATKVMQTALSVRETVRKMLDLMVYMAVYFISIMVTIVAIDWRLSLPLVIWLVVYGLILRVLLPRLKKVSQTQADARSMMTGRVVDSYTNISTVKLFAHTRTEQSYAQQGMDEFLHTVYPQMRLVTVLNVCVWLSNALLIFSTSALAVSLWLEGIASPGNIAVAVSLVLRINGMSQWVMWEVSALFENIGTVQDGMNTLAKPVSVTDKPGARELDVSQGEIRFQDVCFNYDARNPVFENLNLTIRPGERIGIVGRSGAGKSTLVNLLLRFYDLDSGRILIDGQDISQVSQESLRANISMVTQDTSLLHRSVKENIRYGRLDSTDEEVIQASSRAEAHGFIQHLSDLYGRTGYDSHVGERGVKLSGGQRQRIAIARVMLKDAPILVLDEATSALDSEVEAAIQDGLKKVMDDKTVLAIAHRLSTIAKMDRLVVLDQGRIVESGTHQELLARKGIYARLWAHQTGGFLGLE
ncbi:putative ABC transporter ATP-binding protein [Saliniradius amylolyticus]|uniref:Putative ABC transporter ATP-binding protein n=1 Tax=Saliniradius amylolyticus TaxID=2183582 RepID=A0A2S2E6B5_9ALTE|nr:ABC transporter ATP-binding protein [Saliniradius amylolyticus]AWL13072.1 putative ABC transporter ATP-binding protein [Saliniradius amylolyticus]